MCFSLRPLPVQPFAMREPASKREYMRWKKGEVGK
jgi:hypothetical protein